MPRTRKPTPKQERFVAEYLLDLNAAAAYRRAGYAVSSDKAAAAHGARMVANGSIAAAIARAMNKRAAKAELSAAVVLRRLDRESRRRGEGASHAARVQALKLLGLHLGMFPKVGRVEHSGPGGGEIPVAVSHDLHDIATDLAPYADVIRQFCTDPGGGTVPPHRDAQPVDPPQADP
jgi:phage terminase small subunit